jgi:proteasome lid subunit RPN8/RPN11
MDVKGEWSSSPWTMTVEVMRQITTTIGSLTPETGGMLGGCRAMRKVTHFYFDGTAARSGSTYSPDTEQCNRVLNDEWNPAGVDLVGFVHSHPRGFLRPSTGDLVYAARILKTNPKVPSLLLPILESRPDAGDIVVRHYEAAISGDDATVTTATVVGSADRIPPEASTFQNLEMFRRVGSAYDLDRLEHSRVLAVGCGGSASFIEDLARAGVGEFVLIDPDVVGITNLATQQTYRSDLGRPKVECLAERIRNINPLAFVVAGHGSLDDVDDVMLCYFATTPFRRGNPRTTLICGMTDDFYAQARVNRLALNFGLPSLCAQVYAEGRGAEVTFTHPDTTRACHRCALKSRYDAYERGFKNDVGSEGTPFASTARLNALKQFVALALLHHGSEDRRWGRMLKRIGNRSLIQLRLHPDFELPSFDGLGHPNDRRVFCDDTVWMSQEAEKGCPDCGGTGDLRQLMGKCADTTQPLFRSASNPRWRRCTANP